ncbi:hypothetical protein KA005_07885 [bacterium]|nr:hypothetical protein [bacterium]
MELRERIKGNFKTAVRNIWQHPIVREIQDSQRGLTDQGRRYCERVDSHLGSLLISTNAYKRLNSLEMYLLSAAAALHDVGRSTHSDVKRYVDSLPFDIAHDHGLQAQHLLTESNIGHVLLSDPGHVVAVGMIVSAHDSGNMYLVEPTVRLGFLQSSSRRYYQVRL